MSELGAAGPPGAFVAAGDSWQFRGVLTFDGAMSAVEAAQSLPLPNSGIVDLALLEHADSSALAVMLALRRRAAAEGRNEIRFAGVPPMLDSLARVYGVENLIAEQP